jgi:ribonucleoside-diphosphate reductase alpha chain
MKVKKRNGLAQTFSFDKLSSRLKKIGGELKIPHSVILEEASEQMYSGMPSTELDELVAQLCASKCTIHPDYGTLAARLSVSALHKLTPHTFFEAMKTLQSHLDPKIWRIINHHRIDFDLMIVHERDYFIDYFGTKTLERSYLMRHKNVVIERPQYMWLRVAIGIHGDNIAAVKETYDLMSQKYFTHATPTLFNAGTKCPQLSSCFLLAMESDSIEGIYDTLKDCALISQCAGGIGLHVHNIRANGSHIRGTNGTATGLVPMLKVFNHSARYVNQGGRRNGSFAIYLEPWHADVEDFLELRKNHGDEEMRARDLFYAMWIPDLFMERVEKDEDWCLFCPDQCPGLADCCGDDFRMLYEKYEKEGKASKRVKARSVWFQILDSQMETGTPYLLYKDAVNRKSNQQNLGVIKSSNLCCEITEFSDAEQTAVCNLASIALSMFVGADKTFDYQGLHKVAKVITSNLNKVIDANYYPTEKTKYSNMQHRPIGIGVQGLADTFALLDIPFHSDQAKEINKMIFETIYHGALERSNELAYLDGPYSSFMGSPASNGVLQYDMWGITPSDRYDWAALKTKIINHGLRNSLLLAPMPTASTSQILGNNECFEPFTSNIYSRRTLAGDFTVVNKYLMKELVELGLWSERLKDNIIANRGSIQHIDGIPEHIKEKYKIVWEIPMRHLLDMSADRGAFVCQSQSLNLWLEDPDYKTLTSMHFYGWKKGLKTGIYYLRRKPKHQPQQFTIEPEACEMCSA